MAEKCHTLCVTPSSCPEALLFASICPGILVPKRSCDPCDVRFASAYLEFHKFRWRACAGCVRVQVQVVEITEQGVGGASFGGSFKLSFDSRIMQPFCGMCTLNSQYVSSLSQRHPLPASAHVPLQFDVFSSLYEGLIP